MCWPPLSARNEKVMLGRSECVIGLAVVLVFSTCVYI